MGIVDEYVPGMAREGNSIEVSLSRGFEVDAHARQAYDSLSKKGEVSVGFAVSGRWSLHGVLASGR